MPLNRTEYLKSLRELEERFVHTIIAVPPPPSDYFPNSTDKYINSLIAILTKAWNLLRDDGTLWLMLEDGLCQGELAGVPWHTALHLQENGWWLRQDIICPTQLSHRYLFLLSKSRHYYFDHNAIAEPQAADSATRAKYGWYGTTDDQSGGARTGSSYRRLAEGEANMELMVPPDGFRNRRSVWNYPFVEIIRSIVHAGTSEHGCCAVCQAPWGRVLQRTAEPDASAKGSRFDLGKTGDRPGGDRTQSGERTATRDTGVWQPTCECGVTNTIPCTVLTLFPLTEGILSDITGDSKRRNIVPIRLSE